MKKFGGLILTMLFSVIFVMAISCLPKPKTSDTSFAANDPQIIDSYYVPESLFDRVIISAEENGNLVGRTLGAGDFGEPNPDDEVDAVLKTTKTITIHLDHEIASGESLSIMADDVYLVENNVVSTTDTHVQRINNLYYYVFDITPIKTQLKENTSTKIKITFTRNRTTTEFTFILQQIYVADEIFDYLKISQDGDGESMGYTFGMSDFVDSKVDTSGRATATLYTNKTITLFVDDSSLSLDTGDGYNLIENADYLVSDGIVSESSPRLFKIGDKNYFVFDVSKLEQDTATRIYFSITINGQTIEFQFMLVQTIIDLHKSGITWSFQDNNSTEKLISAPSFDHTYTPITLYLPETSALNPITVRFTYCGEVFEFYKEGNSLYNPSLGSNKEVSKLDFDNMTFDVSGTYTVEIFDKTYLNNSAANNYVSYVFNVENSTSELDRFYFNVHLENGEIIMNRQITNEKTIVEFVNINNPRILELIQRIDVERIVRTATSNVSTTTTYNNEAIRDIINNQGGRLVFEDDGTYTIKVFTFTDQPNSPSRSFTFRLLKNISNQFEIDQTVYTVDADALDNELRKINITRGVTTTYESRVCHLTSKTNYSFYILIARSVPRIDGVSDKARVSGNIGLQVSGVGKLTVTISQDGKVSTYEYNTEDGNLSNIHSLPTLSTPAHYVVTITDEMGGVLTKSFTIKVKMNTAAMILLIVAGVVVALVIVFIIFSRMRVKVR